MSHRTAVTTVTGCLESTIYVKLKASQSKHTQGRIVEKGYFFSVRELMKEIYFVWAKDPQQIGRTMSVRNGVHGLGICCTVA